MALGPGPAGLKFWTPPGLTADNTADINDLPAGATYWFNPWGPKRPVQDWVRGASPLNMPVGTLFAADAGSYALTGGSDIATLLGDNANFPAGNTGWFNPWGARRGRQDWVRGVVPLVPVVLTAAGGSYALTGSAAIWAFGQVGPSGSYALTGSAAAQAFGQVVGSGSYTLTGSAAATALGQAAGAGSYALTGSTATFAFGQGVLAGAYTLTGAAAAFVIPGVVDYLPAGMSGSYVPWRRPHPVSLRTLTGRPLSEEAPPVTLTAAGGSYTITGSAASLTVASPPDTVNLPAGATNWFNPWRRPHPVNLRTISGRPLFTATPTVLTAAGGSYTITGFEAQLVQAGTITLTCGAGSYVITGFSVNFVGVAPPVVEVPPTSPGGVGGRPGRSGRPLYKRLKLKKKRKREECEELLEYLESLPPLAEIERADLSSLPTTQSLLDCIPPLSRPQVLAAINKTPIRDDDDDEDAIALLLEFL